MTTSSPQARETAATMPGTDNIAISVDHVTFGYGKEVILQDISIDVVEGEFVSLIGPSGCGKSTLLSMFDGVVRPDVGTVRIFGSTVQETLKQRAMVFQNFALMPWKTVRENVLLGLNYRRTDLSKKERLELAREYINRVGLTHALDLYPHQISGGMQQRVGIARAFAVQPRLLLMDEPFGALDAQNAELLREDLLKLVAEERRTVVFVTHNLDEALQMSDRVLLMTARPGTIRDEVRPDFGPKTSAEYRERYDSQRDLLWDHLKSEVLTVQAREEGQKP
ncbi:ABC transporter ATP-binding protein [Arthrobacter sp. UNC362MFTsu5.1]|uniref:ABC transporter ATP-binding protein n=1 Tax=Arthrobacter sp. UNC362MFTsu5.1 TaxID=1449044 RepID=UPI0018CC1EF3|nr:ABC transporter ATP-binding protein [Arthrobacter sp. UNC362MFTsu5.1]